MGRPLDTKLTPDIVREVCLRIGSKAYADGTISNLGNHYVVLLRAVNCQTGEAVGNEEAEAENRETILQALDQASTKLRGRLGESLATIQKYDTPAEATTASLDALQAYSLGITAIHTEGENRAIPFFKRAIELDHNFAVAYAQLGTAYFNLHQATQGAAAISRAYDLRGRVSEREKLYIESHYYDTVTGEADKAIDVYKLWQETYPRDVVPYINLGAIYESLGQGEKAVTEALRALRLSARNARIYVNLSDAYMNLNQFDKADQILNEATAHKVESAIFPGLRYQLAFVRNNKEEMERQVTAAVVEPEIEGWLRALQADTEAYHGRMANARENTRRAIASANHDGDKETALAYAMVGALREAEVGNRHGARKQADAAIAHGAGQQVLFLGALTFARAGERQKALALARDLNRRFPKDTLLNNYWLPAIRAALELDRGGYYQAIEFLEPTRPYELGEPPQLSTNVLLYPIFLRGEAYLAVGLPDKAQAEFQKILDHPGLAGNYLLGALAHLEIGRAYEMEAGIRVPVAVKTGTQRQSDQTLERPDALAKARSAYQDFFSLWRDADANVPILARAKQEYRQLQ